MSPPGQQTVIMGAGMAGMAAAKTLGDLGHQVILIDRNFEPVAQSTQLHVLLKKGQRLLKKLFPEAFQKIESKCPRVNWGSETYWRTPVGPMPQRPLDVVTYLFSRAFLDQVLLDEIRTMPNCSLVRGKVEDLRLSTNGRRVEAVRLGDREIRCGACIDTQGRQSKTARILESHLGRAVGTVEGRTTLRYCSMFAKVKPVPGSDGSAFRQAYFQIDARKECHGGVISPIEGDRLIATFISIGGEPEIPQNPFLQLRDDEFQKFLSGVELESGQRMFGSLHNILHRYGRYRGLPENLYLVGDSVCQLNPVFGQGMTVALLSTELLGNHLRNSGGGSTSAMFQRDLESLIRFPWTIATMDPYNQGTRASLSQRLAKALLSRIMNKAKKNQRVHRLLVDVLHMEKSPLKLFSPLNLI